MQDRLIVLSSVFLAVAALTACSSSSSSAPDAAGGTSSAGGASPGPGGAAGSGGKATAGSGGSAGATGGAAGSGAVPADCMLPTALASCYNKTTPATASCQEAEAKTQADSLASGCTAAGGTLTMGPCPRTNDPPFAGYCVGGPTKGVLQAFYYGDPQQTGSILKPQCEAGGGVWCAPLRGTRRCRRGDAARHRA